MHGPYGGRIRPMSVADAMVQSSKKHGPIVVASYPCLVPFGFIKRKTGYALSLPARICGFRGCNAYVSRTNRNPTENCTTWEHIYDKDVSTPIELDTLNAPMMSTGNLPPIPPRTEPFVYLPRKC